DRGGLQGVRPGLETGDPGRRRCGALDQGGVVTVTVLSYGAGNVASVQFALERLGASVRLTSCPDDVAEAERLILPGVGAAAYAMERLDALGLTEAIRAFPRPLLGVCLGQQLLFEASAEGE